MVEMPSHGSRLPWLCVEKRILFAMFLYSVREFIRCQQSVIPVRAEMTDLECIV